jgi:hypothetical protein
MPSRSFLAHDRFGNDLSAMDASSIKPPDVRRIGKAHQPGLDYLRRLPERVVRFPDLSSEVPLAGIGTRCRHLDAARSEGELYSSAVMKAELIATVPGSPLQGAFRAAV